ncbi:MAG: AAA family ATPase [Oscillospiraceae bacterium]|nr:AAA family ATPase [Oscillospiraceae bacterium]
MNEIQIFNHELFGEVRTVEIDGQIYFVGMDVAKALEYKTYQKALRDHVDQEDKMTLSKRYCEEFLMFPNRTLEKIPNRGLTIINESGLYSLVLVSKLEKAKEFKHWITSEVIPSIRKTGAYNPNPQQIETTQPIQQIEVHIDHVENLHITQKKEVFSMKNSNTQGVKRVHVYKDKNGNPLAEKHITKQSDGEKRCCWYAIDQMTGRKTTGLNGMELPLYHADRLHNQSINGDEETPIFFAEGEKDVETLEQIFEAIATCTPNGGTATSWKESYNNDLKKRNLIILTDNDAVGEKYGLTIARNTVGFALSIKIISAKDIWSDCPEHGDISDIVQAFGEDKARELLADAIQKTEYYFKLGDVDISDFEDLIKDNSKAFPEQPVEYQFVALSDVQAKPISFVWYPYIPVGEITIMFAAGGTGKSFLTCGIAADISAGRTLPNPNYEQAKATPENVLFISAEDSASVLKQRIFTAGGDISKCYCVAPPDTPEELEKYRPFELPADAHDKVRIEAFEQLIKDTKAKLIIIDPWAAYIGKDTDMNRANSIRAITAVLVVIAKKMGCAILVVAHVNKKAQADNANDAVSGSVDLINSARSALAVRTFGDSDSRVMVHTKCNYESLGKSVCYQIINQGQGNTGKFEWNGFSELTKEDLENSARTGKRLKDIADDKYDEELNKQAAIDVITDLAVWGKKVNVTFSRFRKEIIETCGIDFLPSKPTRFLNSLLSELRKKCITLEKIGKQVRDDMPDGTKGSVPYTGFTICRMPENHLIDDTTSK